MKRPNKAVFLDRDGTLNKEVGHLSDLDDLALFPTAGRAIRVLNKNHFKVIIVSNQAGIAKGFLTEQALKEIHQKLLEELEKSGASMDAIYYCPHHPEGKVARYRQNCTCRKPKPGMYRQAAQDLNIDPKNSYAVGDKADDIVSGAKAGCTTILVLTGYGKQELEKLDQKFRPNFVAKDLMEAVEWILTNEQELKLEEDQDVR